MARKKVTLGWIAHDATRRATFKKRKQSLLKKVSELAILCGIDACAVVYGPEEEAPEVWPSPAEAARVAERFRVVPELDQSRKKTDQEGFLRQRAAKLREQLARQERDNRELEASLLMHEVLSGGGRRMCDVGIEQAAELVRLAEMKLALVRNRVEREKARTTVEPPWQVVEQAVGLAEDPWIEFVEPLQQAMGMAEGPWTEFVEPSRQVVGMAEDLCIEFVEPPQKAVGMAEDPWTEFVEPRRQAVEQVVGMEEDPWIELVESPQPVVGMTEDPWTEFVEPPWQAVEQVVGTAEDPWIEFVEPQRQAVEQVVGMADDPWMEFVELMCGTVPSSCFELESLDLEHPPWQAPLSVYHDFNWPE